MIQALNDFILVKPLTEESIDFKDNTINVVISKESQKALMGRVFSEGTVTEVKNPSLKGLIVYYTERVFQSEIYDEKEGKLHVIKLGDIIAYKKEDVE